MDMVDYLDAVTLADTGPITLKKAGEMFTVMARRYPELLEGQGITLEDAMTDLAKKAVALVCQ